MPCFLPNEVGSFGAICFNGLPLLLGKMSTPRLLSWGQARVPLFCDTLKGIRRALGWDKGTGAQRLSVCHAETELLLGDESWVGMRAQGPLPPWPETKPLQPGPGPWGEASWWLSFTGETRWPPSHGSGVGRGSCARLIPISVVLLSLWGDRGGGKELVMRRWHRLVLLLLRSH